MFAAGDNTSDHWQWCRTCGDGASAPMIKRTPAIRPSELGANRRPARTRQKVLEVCHFQRLMPLRNWFVNQRNAVGRKGAMASCPS